MATLKLDTLQKDFEAFMKPLVKQALNKAIPDIKRQILHYFIDIKLFNSDKFRLLFGGSFNLGGIDIEAEFGTTHIPEVLDGIMAVLRSQLHVVPVQSAKSVGIRFKFIESDFQKLLNIPGASYVSPPSGSEIAWLQWILLEGTKTITDYYIDYTLSYKERQRSRTGKALMKFNPREAWMVPPPFRGDNKDSNFITEIFEDGDTQAAFTRIMVAEFEKQLRILLNG